jgi:GNAT superfamily N-acetyltransferase
VTVRDALPGDVRALLALWQPLLPPVLGVPDGSPEDVVERAIRRIETDPTGRMVVAEVDGELAGATYLSLTKLSPLFPTQAVTICHLQVAKNAERKGVGRSLVEAGLAWAELEQVESVLAISPVNDRETNRYLARLGMGQVGVLRGSTTAALRARMPMDPVSAARTSARQSRTVTHVVATRRLQRRARARRLAS